MTSLLCVHIMHLARRKATQNTRSFPSLNTYLPEKVAWSSIMDVNRSLCNNTTKLKLRVSQYVGHVPQPFVFVDRPTYHLYARVQICSGLSAAVNYLTPSNSTSNYTTTNVYLQCFSIK